MTCQSHAHLTRLTKKLRVQAVHGPELRTWGMVKNSCHAAIGHWNYSLCGNYKNDELCLDMMHQVSIDSRHLSTLVGEGLFGVAGWFDHASNVRHPRKKTYGQNGRLSGFDGLWHWLRKSLEALRSKFFGPSFWDIACPKSLNHHMIFPIPISHLQAMPHFHTRTAPSAFQATMKDLSSTSRRQRLQERKWGSCSQR